ncbi:MAG: hypothetical protein CSA96_09965 [Bacteroidetes bacterium]|nr:MAG: hypothetical protein CSA96_09965 [Bacteroidota bacterium]
MNRHFIFSSLTLLILALQVPGELKAQPYEHALGIRAGYGSGLSYKAFFRHRMTAVRVDALYHEYGFSVSGALMYHWEPFRSDHWLFGVGGAGFAGKWDNATSLGINAVAEFSYVVRDLPLEFGLDWRPMLNLYRNTGTAFLDFGFVLRYRFSL